MRYNKLSLPQIITPAI